MSARYRARVPLQDFEQNLRDNETESMALATRLARTPQAKRTETHLDYGDSSEPLVLVHDGNAPRLTGDALHFYEQSTPRQALHSFVQALDNQRYDVVMRLLPDTTKAGLSPETLESSLRNESGERIQRLLAALRNALDAPIERVGPRATMTYGEHRVMQFVLEGDRWKIETPE